jgi:hypothetical protein
MHSLAEAIWRDHGAPQIANTSIIEERCEACGRLSRRALNDMCEPCAFVERGKPPTSYRMWSTLWREDWVAPESNPKVVPALLSPRLHIFTRGTPEHAVSCLCSPPDCAWGMAVTTSGQVHTASKAPINRGAAQWTIAVERGLVTSTPALFARLLGAVKSLRSHKFTTDEIESGEWPVGKVSRCIDQWRQYSAAVAPYHGSALLALCCFLSKE